MTSLHHDHLGIKTTLSRVAGEYYWPQLKGDIKVFVKTCVPCNRVKQNKKLVNTGDFKVPDTRFSHVMVDIVGPLPPSYGHRFLLTSICRTTRFLQAVPLTEATSSAAASAFLNHWVALFGVPAKVTSDNGASFTAGLWKDMMSKLNIEVTYSALYRPESIGLLERQHRSIKDSLKAALVDMGEQHQDRWMDYLPFVLLGRRVAVQPDLQASASELTFGTQVKIPGQILYDPGDLPDEQSLQDLLKQIRTKTNVPARQTSRHNKPERPLPDLPEGISHVYTREHQTTGLQTPFMGPFKVHSRTSRSTFKIEVGTYADGTKRYEIRHVNDLKIAHPESMASPVERPKLGRPSTSSNGQTSTEVTPPQPTPSNHFPSSQLPNPPPQLKNKQAVATGHQDGSATRVANNHATSNLDNRGPPPVKAFTGRPIRTTRNPAPCYVDSIAFDVTPWSASEAEINDINRAISRNLSSNTVASP